MARLDIPFLDSVGDRDENGPERQSLVRPWMSYWPPEIGGELHTLLQEKAPEVLTWRFDPTKPFDRPWQSWTKQAAANGQVCAPKVLKPDGPEDAQKPQQAKDAAKNIVTIHDTMHLVNKDASQESEGNTLDAEIAALGIPFVTPAQFNYLAEDPLYDTTKPYHTRLPAMGDVRRTNIVGQAYTGVRVHNITGHEDKFSLNKSGFQYFNIPVGITDWTNETAKNQYLPIMEKWLKEFFVATRVHIFTYSFRCNDRDRTSTASWIGPYMRAHCDVTLNSGLRRLNLHLPDEAEEIKRGRWRMIGLWRPLTGPHQDRPLAFLDNRSLSQNDLIGADVVFPHYCDEGYEVKYNASHRWFYKQQMTSDEAILFKLYDSSDSNTRFCPHAAFIDPSVPDGTPQRASVELRAIIIG